MTEELPATATPRINKVPFVVFDAILVVTALVLALTAGGPLSPLLFFWILFCVAAGGVIACLPFWIEFRDSVRLAEYEIRERQNGGGNAQWQYVDARLVEVGDLLNRTHLRLSDNGDRLARLEAQLGGLDAASVAAQADEVQQKRWPSLREELLAALCRHNAELLQGQRAELNAAAAQQRELADKNAAAKAASLEAALGNLDGRVAAFAEALASLAAFVATLQAAQASGLATGAPSACESALPASPDAAAEAARPTTEEAVPATAKGAAAFEENMTAVSVETDAGVEDFGNAIDASEDFGAADDNAENTAEAEGETAFWNAAEDEPDTGFDSAETAAADSGTQAADFAANSGAEGADFGTDSGAQAADTGTATETAEDVALENEVSTAAQPDDTGTAESGSTGGKADGAAASGSIAIDETETALEETPEATESPEAIVASEAPAAKPAAGQQQTLIDEPQAQPAAKASGKAAEKTTLIAQVLIGIGNKPYVRGEGPGLSMEKGVPMQFVEIGKWEWVCPQGAAPLKVQIYKNDEIPSGLGEIVLEAGQRRAVTPTFPK